MAEGGAPAGVNSAMLSSMDQAGAGHGGGTVAAGGDRLISQNIDEGISSKVTGNVDMGLGGSIEDYVKLGSATESNPFNDIADGALIGPGNISHGGAEFVTSTMGDVDASKFTSPTSNLNANIPKLHSGTGQGAAAG